LDQRLAIWILYSPMVQGKILLSLCKKSLIFGVGKGIISSFCLALVNHQDILETYLILKLWTLGKPIQICSLNGKLQIQYIAWFCPLVVNPESMEFGIVWSDRGFHSYSSFPIQMHLFSYFLKCTIKQIWILCKKLM
jgi:hypothetical protein